MSDSTAAGGASRYVDTENAYAYLAERLGRPSDWALSPHDAGLGNETLFLTWDGRQFVLRRPPLGETATESHDVRREYHLLEGLDETDLPTPRPVAACFDESVAGTAFTVQQRLGGDTLRHGEPVSYAATDHRRQVGRELVDTLADIHAVDPVAVCQDDGERAARTPIERVRVWRERFERFGDRTDRTVPDADAVADWLAANAPTPRDRTVIHGDYTLANVRFSRDTPPKIVGLVDWERAGVGDPLLDLGRLLACWYDAPAEYAGVPHTIAPQFTTRDGYLSRSTLIAQYTDRTGRQFHDNRFYRALGVFEQATVCEGYYLRHLRDDSDRDPFADLEGAVPRLIERARRIIDGKEPL